MKNVKSAIIAVLVCVLSLGIFTGCGSANKLVLEPFDVKMGATMDELSSALSCTYRTNINAPEAVYVLNADNDHSLQAFGTSPSIIVYSFNAEEGSSGDALSRITLRFPQEDYDKVLTYLEEKLGESGFARPIWGIDSGNLFLIEDEHNYACYIFIMRSDPLDDPSGIEDTNKRLNYVLKGIDLYMNVWEIAKLDLEKYALLRRSATAESDFEIAGQAG